MNKNNQNSGKKSLFYGVTAIVIAVVILVNVLFGALCTGNLWFIDLTSESTYKVYAQTGTISKTTSSYELMDETVDYLEEMLAESEVKDAKVTITFCADPDILNGNELMRYIYYTAQLLEQAFPDTISVETVNVWENPSAVDQYRTNSYSSIYQSNIIVSSGKEFRVASYKYYYTYDEDEDEPWAFSIQKNFLRQIIAVTRAESPICCLTTNHGEPFADLDLARVDEWEEYSTFIHTIEAAGYDVQLLNLETDEIPENCRLIITLDPQTDFKSKFTDAVEVSETTKLDAFLDNAYSFMVLVDADTPVLTNLEEYLNLWGISFGRYSDDTVTANYSIYDQTHSLDGSGNTFYGTFVEDGLGYSAMSDMLEYGTAPKVLFNNAMPIVPTYDLVYVLADEDEGTDAYTYYSYYKNGVSRSMYNILTTTAEANAKATYTEGGENVTKESTGEYSVMTITSESRTVSEGQGYTTVSENTYVCAVSSVDSVKNKVLDTNAYGNTDAMLSLLRAMGKEVAAVGIAFVSMYDDAIGDDYITEDYQTVVTICMTVIPALVVLCTGAVVLVVRKTKH